MELASPSSHEPVTGFNLIVIVPMLIQALPFSQPQNLESQVWQHSTLDTLR